MVRECSCVTDVVCSFSKPKRWRARQAFFCRIALSDLVCIEGSEMRENGQLGSKRMNSHLGFFFPFFLKDMEPIALGYTGKFFFPFSNEDKPGNTTPHPLSLPTEKKKKKHCREET